MSNVLHVDTNISECKLSESPQICQFLGDVYSPINIKPPINKNPGSNFFGKVKNNKNPEGENFGPRAKRADKILTLFAVLQGEIVQKRCFFDKMFQIIEPPAHNFLGKWQIIQKPEKNVADFDLKGGIINRTVLMVPPSVF